MKKIFFILFTLVAFISYGQSVLTDVNGKVITSATGDILVQETDPNNFEYTPNPEWIPVNGVADGEIWILAFDGGTSNLFTITCTTSSGEWQMDIYGGADGKTLLRTYDTTSNVALSHTFISGTGKFSHNDGIYTYLIKISAPSGNLMSVFSRHGYYYPNDVSSFLLFNANCKNLNLFYITYAPNLQYINVYQCNNLTNFSAQGSIMLRGVTFPKIMNNMVRAGSPNNLPDNGLLTDCPSLQFVTMPLYMNNLQVFGGALNQPAFSNSAIENIILPDRLPLLKYYGGMIYDRDGLFRDCLHLKSVKGGRYMPNLITMNQAFDKCYSLTHIDEWLQMPTISIPFTGSVRALTTFNQPILRCSSFVLKGVSDADRSNVNYIQIDWANSQFTDNVDIRYNNLSATELNRIFTELPTVVVSRTIYVASNVGSATCDPTIATAKNWVVITS